MQEIMDSDLESLKEMTQELTSETVFRIISHRLDFFGSCPDCLE
jgi:Fur family peroxide stress response transcriptional regulator